MDIELFTNNIENTSNSTNTSEYFSLSLTKRVPRQLRLPEFGQDDILVKPAADLNNWILLPNSDEKWKNTINTSNIRPEVVTLEPEVESGQTGNGTSTADTETGSWYSRALMSFLQFLGPKSNSHGNS